MCVTGLLFRLVCYDIYLLVLIFFGKHGDDQNTSQECYMLYFVRTFRSYATTTNNKKLICTLNVRTLHTDDMFSPTFPLKCKYLVQSICFVSSFPQQNSQIPNVRFILRPAMKFNFDWTFLNWYQFASVNHLSISQNNSSSWTLINAHQNATALC